jgi:hypothetical protein
MTDQGIPQSNLLRSWFILCRFFRNYLQFFTKFAQLSIMARIFAQEINFLQSLNFTAWNTLPLATVACMTQIFGLENASEMMTHTFCLKNH